MPWRKSKPWGKIKPPAGTPIDWGDPINVGLVSRWVMNEGAGGKLFDSCQRNQAALNSFSQPNTSTSGWNVGQFGKCLTFDGTDDYASAASTFLNGATKATISFSFKRRTASSRCNITQTNGTSFHRFGVNANTDGLVYFLINNVASSTYATFANGDTLWHRVTFVYDGSGATNADRVKGYLDGVPKTLTFTGTIPSSVGAATGPFEIGRQNAGVGLVTYSDGQLDDVRLYNRALSEAEVLRLFTEPFAGMLTDRRRVLRPSVGAAFSQAVGGTLTFAGSIVRGAGKSLSATLATSGSIQRATTRAIAAGLSFAGLPVKGIGLACAGAVTSSGAMQRAVGLPRGGTLTFDGSTARAITRSLAGILELSGGLHRATARAFNGALNFAGAVGFGIGKACAGAVSFSSAAARAAARAISGTVSFSGVLGSARAFFKTCAGAVSFSGSVLRGTGKRITAALSFTTWTGALAPFIAGAANVVELASRARTVTLLAMNRAIRFTIPARILILSAKTRTLKFAAKIRAKLL